MRAVNSGGATRGPKLPRLQTEIGGVYGDFGRILPEIHSLHDFLAYKEIVQKCKRKEAGVPASFLLQQYADHSSGSFIDDSCQRLLHLLPCVGGHPHQLVG